MSESRLTAVQPQYASWGSRVGANLLDSLMLLAVLVVTGLPGYVAAAGQDVWADTGSGLEDPGSALAKTLSCAGLLVFLAVAGWFAWLGGVTGQSPGKAMCGLRIVDASTGRAGGGLFGVGRELVHQVMRYVCVLGVLDGLWPLWDKRRQSLHDKIVGSIIVADVPARRLGADLFRLDRRPWDYLVVLGPDGLVPVPPRGPLAPAPEMTPARTSFGTGDTAAEGGVRGTQTSGDAGDTGGAASRTAPKDSAEKAAVPSPVSASWDVPAQPRMALPAAAVPAEDVADIRDPRPDVPEWQPDLRADSRDSADSAEKGRPESVAPSTAGSGSPGPSDPQERRHRPRKRVVVVTVCGFLLLALGSVALYQLGFSRTRDEAAAGQQVTAPSAGASDGSGAPADDPGPSAEATGAASSTAAPDPSASPKSSETGAPPGPAAQPGDLPVGVVFGAGQEGFGAPRPTVLDGGAPAERVTDLTWTSYGGKVARGHGKAIWTGDGPGLPVETGPVEDVEIRAYDRDSCLGARAYLQVWWWFPDRGETEQNLRHGFPNVCNLATAYTNRTTVDIADGTHYGFVSSVGDGAVTVDIIGWTTGAEARTQCDDDSVDDRPEFWCSEYYYRNANSRPRTFPLPASARVAVLSLRSNAETVDPDVLAERLATGSLGPVPVFRFDTRDRSVTRLTQIVVP